MDGMTLALYLLGYTFLCIVPIVVAITRGSTHRVAISAMAVLLGWTGLGFLAAVIWAVCSETETDREMQALQRELYEKSIRALPQAPDQPKFKPLRSDEESRPASFGSGPGSMFS